LDLEAATYCHTVGYPKAFFGICKDWSALPAHGYAQHSSQANNSYSTVILVLGNTAESLASQRGQNGHWFPV